MEATQLAGTKPETPESAPVTASITRSNLNHALKIVGQAIERTATIPILQCVRMEQLENGFALESTNLDVYIRAVVSELTGPQKPVLTPAEKFIAWAKLLADDTVKISATDRRATVKCGRARATLPVMPAANWPNTNVYEKGADVVTLTQGSFARALSFALISMSSDASRYTLNGIQVAGDGKTLNLVSTDGYAMMVYSLESTEKINVLLPGRLVKALLPLLNEEDGGVDLSSSERMIVASVDADMCVHLAANKMAGQFPNWQLAYPKDERTDVTVKVADLLSSLDRCLLLTEKNSRAIDLTFAEQLTMEAASSQNGEARETLEYAGPRVENFRIRFNGDYLADLLKKTDGEITIALPTTNRSALIFKATPHDGETLAYVVMPMKA